MYLCISFSLCLKLQNTNKLKGFIFKSFTNLLPRNSFKHVRTYIVHVAQHILQQILSLVCDDYMGAMVNLAFNYLLLISKLKYNCIMYTIWMVPRSYDKAKSTAVMSKSTQQQDFNTYFKTQKNLFNLLLLSSIITEMCYANLRTVHSGRSRSGSMELY